MKPPGQTRIERVWAKIDRQTDGCWVWLGSVMPNGYGRQGSELAHRLVYELLVGPIPDGLTLDHLCRCKRCVNPAHLEPVTAAENTARAMPYRNHRNGRAERTSCPEGHPYDEANTLLVGSWRRCRACNRERQRKLHAARRAGT